MPTLERRWRRDFPGNEAELWPLREWLARLLPDAPARDDEIMVAVELATNAVKHTASGQGGFFAVEITWHAQPATVRIAVADGGAPSVLRNLPVIICSVSMAADCRSCSYSHHVPEHAETKGVG
jgi:anti-sigma regulatory factor (Ser/Thr protein kinase)